MSHTLRPYTPDDHPAVADLLQRSFREDPAYQFLFAGAIEEGLTFLTPRLLKMRHDAGADVQVLCAPDGSIGAVLVTGSSELRLGSLAYLRNGLLRAPGQLGIAATMRLLNADRAIHQLKNLVRPPGPYVEGITLAVHPDHQGQGLGSQMAREGLPTEGPLLLVTTNDANVPFYEAHGFRIAAQNGILGGFTAWVMRR